MTDSYGDFEIPTDKYKKSQVELIKTKLVDQFVVDILRVENEKLKERLEKPHAGCNQRILDEVRKADALKAEIARLEALILTPLEAAVLIAVLKQSGYDSTRTDDCQLYRIMRIYAPIAAQYKPPSIVDDKYKTAKKEVNHD